MEVNSIPLLKQKDIERRAPGIDPKAVVSSITYLNSLLENRSTPVYIFFNPDIEQYAKNIGIEPKSFYQSLNFLSSYFSAKIKHEVIFQEEGLFYLLQEEDLKELKESNRFHNPEDPRIVYERAQSLMRHAFVVKFGT